MRIKFGSLLTRVCLGALHLLVIPSKVSFFLCRVTGIEEEFTRALARIHSPFGCAVLKAAGRVLFLFRSFLHYTFHGSPLLVSRLVTVRNCNSTKESLITVAKSSHSLHHHKILLNHLRSWGGI